MVRFSSLCIQALFMPYFYLYLYAHLCVLFAVLGKRGGWGRGCCHSITQIVLRLYGPRFILHLMPASLSALFSVYIWSRENIHFKLISIIPSISYCWTLLFWEILLLLNVCCLYVNVNDLMLHLYSQWVTRQCLCSPKHRFSHTNTHTCNYACFSLLYMNETQALPD